MDPRTILRIIGNVTALGMFLSPMTTMVRFHKKKSTEEFHPYTYLAGIVSCCFWVAYSTVHRNSTLVWRHTNAMGFFMHLCYLIAFQIYTTKNKWRIVSMIGFVGHTFAFRAVSLPTMHLLETTGEWSTVVSITCCIVLDVILYGSPLTVLYKVFKTKSVEYLPFWVCLAGFAHACIWTVYAFFPFDAKLLVGSGLGALLSAIPLILHFIWGRPMDNFKMIISCSKGSKED